MGRSLSCFNAMAVAQTFVAPEKHLPIVIPVPKVERVALLWHQSAPDVASVFDTTSL